MNHFEKLNGINVNDRTEKKGNLTYLSWTWAWGELMKNYPDSTSRVYEDANGMNYHTDGRTAWVKCGVTVEGQEVIEYLPVMDNRNNSIPLERITSRNVNDSIQRCITKAIARHGLGLYIYAGEDLPEDDTMVNPEKPKKEPPKKPKSEPPEKSKSESPKNREWLCADCGKPITAAKIDQTEYPADFIMRISQKRHKLNLCATCLTARKANGNEGTEN